MLNTHTLNLTQRSQDHVPQKILFETCTVTHKLFRASKASNEAGQPECGHAGGRGGIRERYSGSDWDYEKL